MRLIFGRSWIFLVLCLVLLFLSVVSAASKKGSKGKKGGKSGKGKKTGGSQAVEMTENGDDGIGEDELLEFLADSGFASIGVPLENIEDVSKVMEVKHEIPAPKAAAAEIDIYSKMALEGNKLFRQESLSDPSYRNNLYHRLALTPFFSKSNDPELLSISHEICLTAAAAKIKGIKDSGEKTKALNAALKALGAKLFNRIEKLLSSKKKGEIAVSMLHPIGQNALEIVSPLITGSDNLKFTQIFKVIPEIFAWNYKFVKEMKNFLVWDEKSVSESIILSLPLLSTEAMQNTMSREFLTKCLRKRSYNISAGEVGRIEAFFPKGRKSKLSGFDAFALNFFKMLHFEAGRYETFFPISKLIEALNSAIKSSIGISEEVLGEEYVYLLALYAVYSEIVVNFHLNHIIMEWTNCLLTEDPKIWSIIGLAMTVERKVEEFVLMEKLKPTLDALRAHYDDRQKIVVLARKFADFKTIAFLFETPLNSNLRRAMAHQSEHLSNYYAPAPFGDRLKMITETNIESLPWAWKFIARQIASLDYYSQASATSPRTSLDLLQSVGRTFCSPDKHSMLHLLSVWMIGEVGDEDEALSMLESYVLGRPDSIVLNGIAGKLGKDPESRISKSLAIFLAHSESDQEPHIRMVDLVRNMTELDGLVAHFEGEIVKEYESGRRDASLDLVCSRLEVMIKMASQVQSFASPFLGGEEFSALLAQEPIIIGGLSKISGLLGAEQELALMKSETGYNLLCEHPAIFQNFRHFEFFADSVGQLIKYIGFNEAFAYAIPADLVIAYLRSTRHALNQYTFKWLTYLHPSIWEDEFFLQEVWEMVTVLYLIEDVGFRLPNGKKNLLNVVTDVVSRLNFLDRLSDPANVEVIERNERINRMMGCCLDSDTKSTIPDLTLEQQKVGIICKWIILINYNVFMFGTVCSSNPSRTADIRSIEFQYFILEKTAFDELKKWLKASLVHNPLNEYAAALKLITSGSIFAFRAKAGDTSFSSNLALLQSLTFSAFQFDTSSNCGSEGGVWVNRLMFLSLFDRNRNLILTHSPFTFMTLVSCLLSNDKKNNNVNGNDVDKYRCVDSYVMIACLRLHGLDIVKLMENAGELVGKMRFGLSQNLIGTELSNSVESSTIASAEGKDSAVIVSEKKDSIEDEAPKDESEDDDEADNGDSDKKDESVATTLSKKKRKKSNKKKSKKKSSGVDEDNTEGPVTLVPSAPPAESKEETELQEFKEPAPQSLSTGSKKFVERIAKSLGREELASNMAGSYELKHSSGMNVIVIPRNQGSASTPLVLMKKPSLTLPGNAAEVIAKAMSKGKIAEMKEAADDDKMPEVLKMQEVAEDEQSVAKQVTSLEDAKRILDGPITSTSDV